MILYWLDLIGVFVFAVSGALAAGHAGLDFFGVIVVSALPAIGGGTLRDLLLNRHPIFWMRDPAPLYAIVAAAIATMAWAHFQPPPAGALLIPDALGLALFAIAGAQIAESARLRWIIVVLMGTITGVAGGVLRDVVTGQVPLLLRKDIYATAAIAGIVLYLALQRFGLKRAWCFGIGIVTIVALRLFAVAYGWQLPVFRLPV